MSATDLASSHLSSECADSDLYQPGASTFGSRYKRLARSKSSVSAVDSHSSSTLKVVKLEVKAPTAGRSGLLAAQLKGYACRLLSANLAVAFVALASPKLPSAGHLHRQVLSHCQLASTPLLAESAMENQIVQRQRWQLLTSCRLPLSSLQLPMLDCLCLSAQAQAIPLLWQCLPKGKTPTVGVTGLLPRTSLCHHT